jgi:hypothetical protein
LSLMGLQSAKPSHRTRVIQQGPRLPDGSLFDTEVVCRGEWCRLDKRFLDVSGLRGFIWLHDARPGDEGWQFRWKSNCLAKFEKDETFSRHFS